MWAERHSIIVTTESDGTAVAYADGPITGRVLQVRYVKGDYEAGVEIAIEAEATGKVIWAEQDVDASKTVAPRQATHTTAGVPALYLDGEGEAVLDHIVLAQDRIKVSIAQGGNGKSGTFHFLIG
jgi:hypothetical protein